MNKFIPWSAFLLFVAMLVIVPAASACPLCKDALGATSEEALEGINFPAAMNQSIYLMLAVPYTTFLVVGVLVWRGSLKNHAFRAVQDAENKPH